MLGVLILVIAEISFQALVSIEPHRCLEVSSLNLHKESSNPCLGRYLFHLCHIQVGSNDYTDRIGKIIQLKGGNYTS